MPANFRPENIPTEPGVYRFFDKADQVLYVGKAINLKNRLSSYFQSGLAERTDRMVTEAVRCDWTIVSGEVEALSLEYTWIKQFKPPYNVRFRDDKSYPYLALTLNDNYPRLFITRQEKRKGIKYYGPYIQAWALRTTHDTLLKVFPVRSCSAGNFERAKITKRQCLLGDIGKCAAPCVGWVSEAEHKNLAQKLDNQYPVLYKGRNGFIAHECIIDLRELTKTTGVTVDDIAKRLMDYGFHAPTVSFPVAGTLMIEPTESEDLTELDRFLAAMSSIRAEIADVENGQHTIEESPLRGAPHISSEVLSENWDKKYSRQVAALPTEATFEMGAKNKYWPTVGRIDGVYGDRNLVCACPPIESYA